MSTLGPQFDDERLAAARSIPVEERRTLLFRERKNAAQSNATQWALRIDHSSHDDLKQGVTSRQQTHMLLSRDEYPDPIEAEAVAFQVGSARGTYPTRVRHV